MKCDRPFFFLQAEERSLYPSPLQDDFAKIKQNQYKPLYFTNVNSTTY
jgi:hypothetical protein